MSHGSSSTKLYLEVAVSPNVSSQALVYNPSRRRAEGAPFSRFFIDDPEGVGFWHTTSLNRQWRLWSSTIKIPLGLFNVLEDLTWRSHWRINFGRRVVAANTFPDQKFAAWSPPEQTSDLHDTRCFGRVVFS